MQQDRFDEVVEGIAKAAQKIKVGLAWIRIPTWARWSLASSLTGDRYSPG